MNMIQGRLGSLVGRPSGYIESLPASVRRRVAGLKGIQQEHSKLEAQFQEEVLELEKKYFAKFSPLYQKRATIVNGAQEPTDEEVKAGEEEDEDNEMADVKDDDKKSETTGEDIKGIPEFWLSAMKNNISLADMITERDEAALKHLIDVRMEYLEKPGFRLIFEFAENEFFTNKIITKTYYYQAESGYGGDFIYDYAEGDKIDWKADKDLTVRVESKKQRNKNTNQTRIVKRTVPTDSFFNFFTPPVPPTGEEDDEEQDEEIEARLELDYQLGEDVKEKLIPRAIDWFTGEALAYEEMDEDDLEGEFEDEDDDEDDLSEDHDDEDDSDDDDGTGKPKQEAAECKQS
ncbi:histone chaperone [Ceratocystis pirilliformis]|uniref:Histone chaperone n=1 Tax=Ceratocystis pirilliformis TaxID=259994 RepID=A0ABR3YD45_9PEZI